MRRRPITFIAEQDPDHVIINSAGEVRAAPLVIFDEDDEVVERMRAGYVCARCFDEQEQAFPKNCSTCRFEMADRQSEYVAANYAGHKYLGQRATLEDEMAIMAEFEERQRHAQRDEILAPSQILLPGKDF